MPHILTIINNKFVQSYLVLFFLCTSICSQNTPRTYTANKAIDKLVIDGKAGEESWKKALWSNDFIDIEGKIKPRFSTRMKMTWDKDFLYVYAELVEPHIWGDLKQRDTIIFYNNDFEIFIDPDGDTHNYYEFEMNALNTVWDLFLTKPYRNNGHVLGDWDFKNLKSAVHINGTLNNPTDIDKSWSVEIAIPWSFTTTPGGKTKIPENEFWRINFSRVNWDYDLKNGKYSRKKNTENGSFLPEYNWVWSPQGVVNMHEPERWGYVFFSTESVGSSPTFEIPNEEHIKWYLYKLYKDYRKTPSEEIIKKQEILGEIIFPKLEKYEDGWSISATSPFTKNIIRIKEDGKITTNTSIQK